MKERLCRATQAWRESGVVRWVEIRAVPGGLLQKMSVGFLDKTARPPSGRALGRLHVPYLRVELHSQMARSVALLKEGREFGRQGSTKTSERALTMLPQALPTRHFTFSFVPRPPRKLVQIPHRQVR